MKSCLFALAIALVAMPATAQVFDLRTDWSNASNPNGPWTYREGNNALPFVASWQSSLGGWNTAQAGWAESENGNNRLPFWFRSNGSETFGHDWIAGDIVVHSTDSVNGVGNGPANVTWTSAQTGIADISGGVWIGRDIGRSVGWELYRNGNLLTQGVVASGDAFNRGNPFLYSGGSGGAGAVNDLVVNPGDIIMLQFVSTNPVVGEFVGVNLSVTVSAVPEPATFALAGVGLFGAAAFVKRRRAKRMQKQKSK